MSVPFCFSMRDCFSAIYAEIVGFRKFSRPIASALLGAYPAFLAASDAFPPFFIYSSANAFCFGVKSSNHLCLSSFSDRLPYFF